MKRRKGSADRGVIDRSALALRSAANLIAATSLPHARGVTRRGVLGLLALAEVVPAWARAMAGQLRTLAENAAHMDDDMRAGFFDGAEAVFVGMTPKGSRERRTTEALLGMLREKIGGAPERVAIDAVRFEEPVYAVAGVSAVARLYIVQNGRAAIDASPVAPTPKKPALTTEIRGGVGGSIFVGGLFRIGKTSSLYSLGARVQAPAPACGYEPVGAPTVAWNAEGACVEITQRLGAFVAPERLAPTPIETRDEGWPRWLPFQSADEIRAWTTAPVPAGSVAPRFLAGYDHISEVGPEDPDRLAPFACGDAPWIARAVLGVLGGRLVPGSLTATRYNGPCGAVRLAGRVVPHGGGRAVPVEAWIPTPAAIHNANPRSERGTIFVPRGPMRVRCHVDDVHPNVEVFQGIEPGDAAAWDTARSAGAGEALDIAVEEDPLPEPTRSDDGK